MKRPRQLAEVFYVFLGLGLTSFGGPIAHLGYFRREFITRRRWLAEAEYDSLVSMCQFLPGPASSQVGFCIGKLRGGWAGGVAAWLGFTLPSAVLMLAFAETAGLVGQSSIARHLLHGFQLAAVAVVMQAVLGLARSLCPDTPRRVLALIALAILLIAPGMVGQIVVLLLGAVTGRYLLRTTPERSVKLSDVRGHSATAICLILYATILLASFFVGHRGNLALFAAFFRSGALVFGGGHVVLPLLQSAVVAPGWVPTGLFLVGYGAAQALPGPLFAVAGFLGAVANIGTGGTVGAGIALVAIFLPGILLAGGVHPVWSRLRAVPSLAASIAGVNAVVVGLLGFALLGMVNAGILRSLSDLSITALAYLALILLNTRPILVVAGCALAAILV